MLNQPRDADEITVSILPFTNVLCVQGPLPQRFRTLRTRPDAKAQEWVNVSTDDTPFFTEYDTNAHS